MYFDIPCSKHLDLLDKNGGPILKNLLKLFLIRYGLALSYGDKVYHPDEFWQSMETAYFMAYRDQVDPVLTWEWLD